MYIQLKSSYQVVKLTDDFLTLKEVNGDDLVFELKYLFDQEVAIKKNITNVSVEISKTSPPKLVPTPASISIVSAILRQKSMHSAFIDAYLRNDLMAKFQSDPTKKINNDVVPLFNQGYTSTQLPQLLRRTVAPVRVKDVKDPITAVHAQHDVGAETSSQQLAEELLIQGIDPTTAYDMNDLGLTLAESYRGIQRRSPSVFTTAAEKTLYKYKTTPFLTPITQTSAGEPGVASSDISDDQFTLARTSINDRNIEVTDTLKFAFPVGSPDKITLVLKVKDSAGVTIQILERPFYPREYVRYYNIPRLPPIVKLNNQSDKSHAMLCVKQVERSAVGVRIYKRVYDHHITDEKPYIFVSELSITMAEGWKYIPVEVSLENTIIYRIVPISALGTYGSDFASAIAKPKNRNPTIKRVVITTKPQLDGVLLEISKLPSDCVAFQILREDVTLDRGTRAFVDVPTRTETSDPNRVYTFLDQSVKQSHVYAYHCRIIRRTGSQEDRLVAHYEHIPLVENIVETKVNNPSLFLTDKGYDVQFTISTTVVNTKVDQIKQLLERQGMYDIFAADVADVRDELGKLIAHNVKRINLTTGAVEDFGVIDKERFSDLDARHVAGVSELHLGHKYRYAVTALLRAPETLLESFVKTKTDATTNRSYSYKPFKFLHPVVAKYGNIVTPGSIRANYSKDPMTFGEIGNYTAFEIALDKQKSIITAPIREKRGSDVDVLRWVLTGIAKDVDHFQIMVEHGGKKSIVGKATCVPETENFLYVRRLDQTEVGLDLRYFVCPVYHDFTRGAEVAVANTEDNT